MSDKGSWRKRVMDESKMYLVLMECWVDLLMSIYSHCANHIALAIIAGAGVYLHANKYKLQTQKLVCTVTLICFVLLTIGSTQNAIADPTISTTIDYYDISGSTVAELYSQMFSKGPMAKDDKKHCASAQGKVNWKLKYETDNDWCKVSGVIFLNITYTMPRWINYDAATPEMQNKWDVFYGHLLEHEQGHGSNAIEMARNLEREIKNAQSRSCQELGDVIQALSRDHYKLREKVDDQYDAETKHGVLTGAVMQ
jgi:predicted secreted Zn-dependent protease